MAPQIKDSYLLAIIRIMKYVVSKEKGMVLTGSQIQKPDVHEAFYFTIMGIQDKNAKNSIQSNNYLESKTLWEN